MSDNGKMSVYAEKLGEEYQGTITGVAGFGLFILLDELFAEGMVHVTQLPQIIGYLTNNNIH